MPAYDVFANAKGSLNVVNQDWSWFGFFWYIWIFLGALNAWTLGAAAVSVVVYLLIGTMDLTDDGKLLTTIFAALMINTFMGFAAPLILRRDLQRSGFRKVHTIIATSREEAEKAYKAKIADGAPGTSTTL